MEPTLVRGNIAAIKGKLVTGIDIFIAQLEAAVLEPESALGKPMMPGHVFYEDLLSGSAGPMFGVKGRQQSIEVFLLLKGHQVKDTAQAMPQVVARGEGPSLSPPPAPGAGGGA